jgi:ribosomal-protein-alanine N-acetyltransferase
VSLALRPLRPADADLVYAWRQEPTVRRHNPLDDLTLPELRERLTHGSGDLANRRVPAYRWMVEENGAPIGHVSLSNVSWAMGYGEIGYTLAEASQGRGIGTQAVTLLVERIFAGSRLARVQAFVSTENTASWRLLERLGFTREGTLRQHYVIAGRRVDEYVYGLLRTEWPRR